MRVWFLGFRFCSVPVPFLFRSWVSGRVLVRVLPRVLVRVLPCVLVRVLLRVWFCSGSWF